MAKPSSEEIKGVVKKRYGELARQQGASCCTLPPQEASSCCRPAGAAKKSKHAEKLYAKEEIESLPESVTDIALGRGSPTALSELKPGEVVLEKQLPVLIEKLRNALVDHRNQLLPVSSGLARSHLSPFSFPILACACRSALVPRNIQGASVEP